MTTCREPGRPTTAPAAISRRELLRLGLGGVNALSLPALMQCRAMAAPTSVPRANTALILVWLPGGHSHLETYDPKPLAGSEFSGPFGSISTRAAGVQLCELLPRHAEVADRFTILRSLVHTGFCHQQGTHQLLTGFPERVLRQSPLYPDLFAITHRLRYDHQRPIPNYVGVAPVNYAGAAYLGNAYEPFAVHGDPNAENFTVPNIGAGNAGHREALDRRIGLRKQLDQLKARVDYLQRMDALDTFEQQAFSVITGPQATQAFDLRQEDDATRELYGRNRWGQQLLLARRLVESGIDLVTAQLSGDLCGGVGNWDDHAVNANCFEAMRYRLQFMDRAVAALIEDIYRRGLDQRVMVVVTGEFGRTPRINYQASTGERIGSAPAGVTQPGRDHWPRSTSVLFAGGGTTTGHAVGRTDARGEDPVDRIVGCGDFLATLYRHLGVDYEHLSFPDHSGRPIPIMLGPGEPIRELCRT
ncbi:MAG: DUF1501 domain-containing protein [Planctomycetes bacterium]|nr:DUF1501 domain-containing protein [Planctomycetota bacterium]